MRNREFETELSELENILSGGETPEEKYEAREVAEFISHFLKTKSLTKRVIFVKRYWYSDSISKNSERLQILRKQSKVYLNET